MTLPAPRRGRILLLAGAAAAWCALAPLVQADPPPAGSASGAAAGTAASPTAGTAGKKTAKAGAASATDKNGVSYSVGVSMGEQMRESGITPEAVNTERLAQGVRDALAGKAKLTDADRTNIQGLLRSAHEAAGEAGHRAAAKFLAENAQKPDVVTTKSGLQYKVITQGSGDSPKTSDQVTVNYRGTLLDGTEFDSSYKRGQPASFPVSGVIPGWTEGLQLMKPGGKYQLFVPPQLAYDLNPPRGAPIPPGSMLVFEVELIGVKPAGATGGAGMPHIPPPTQQSATPPASK
jgi:FKBP-type peptidyl-prolyl cis-trans isomerase